MPTLRMQLVGFEDMRNALTDLPDRVAMNTVQNALIEAAEPVAEDASALAPRRTGRLARAIKVVKKLKKTAQSQSNKSKGGKDSTEAHITPYGEKFGGRSAPQAHLVEFGTGPRFQKKSGKFVGNMPAQPFLRPAWDRGKKPLISRFGKALGILIKEAAEKVFKKVPPK